MPVTIKMKTPDLNGRADILRKLLAKEKLDSEIVIEEIAMRCEDFTGSDLRELVRVATLQRGKFVVNSMKEAARASGSNLAALAAEGGSNGTGAEGGGGISRVAAFAHMRPLNLDDFEFALARCSSTGSAANDYASELLLEEKQERYVCKYTHIYTIPAYTVHKCM